MKEHLILGVDVGGTGMKAGIVDVVSGELQDKRKRILTPQPPTPENIAVGLKNLVEIHEWTGPIGCGFPAIVKDGVAYSATNIDKSWIGVDVEALFSEATGCPVKVTNDADAAGYAIMLYGVGQSLKGVNIVLTLGTGIGSGLFLDQKLVPNSELGHLVFKGDIAERYCSNAVRKNEKLSWEEWGGRLNEFLLHIDRVFSPNNVILGGGVSKKFEQYAAYLHPKAKVFPTPLRNAAGTIGAAYYASLFY